VANFQYDNSLVTGIPNSSTGAGKLTLNRVWFEYQGVKRATISPYIFKYQYKPLTEFPNNVLNRYPNIFNAPTGAGGYNDCSGYNSSSQNPA
jgi:hypothetical protein